MQWVKTYDGTVLTSDLLAAVIVTIMLIPQSLAYAMLAGLPAEVGLYASILPLVAYAIFGTSRTLAVGPVAVVSLMTASAIGQIAAEGTLDYLTAAIVLALLSGGMLVVMGIFRLGFPANFLSHPVISGFTASGLLIAAGQLRHILGALGAVIPSRNSSFPVGGPRRCQSVSRLPSVSAFWLSSISPANISNPCWSRSACPRVLPT